MRVLITGATGLLGQQLVKECHTKGIDVNYLTTSSDKLEDKENYKGFLWDAKNKEIDATCLKGVHTVIHLAGASIAERWTDEHKQAIIDSRINTANLLFDLLKEKENMVDHFISASAIGAYPSSLETLYTEEYPEYNPSFLGDVVNVWEQAADQFEEIGLKVTKIRIGVVLAENGGALQQLIKPIKIYVGAPLGSGKQFQSWIHIKDLANIFVHCMEQKLAGIYNATAPHPVTNATLTKTAAEVLNKPLWLPNVPEFALKAALGDMAAVVLESQKVSSAKIQGEGYVFSYERIEKALDCLLSTK
ncbi:TIGR01777 family oxidoreductase [Flavimarina sp. Hel_I_48]|uniref:TIGR01777 family oxidoreductase n=1 Tax=Flavimarina sp. Hel_I_48 TaxID=1392488 RepID=UPI0004DEE7FD|nr:TIGR01777 family oxidoreductase [Flavimarina sp. Hel_I_48]